VSTPLLTAAEPAALGLTALGASLKEAVVEVRDDRGRSGTGIIWGDTGLIVTNAHCAPRNASCRVGTDGVWRDAGVLAHHRHHDLALLAAPHARGPLLAIRDPDSLRVGELVFAYGHPLGINDALAMGILHGVARDPRSGSPRWVVADVRLAPGHSGGPLVDAEGRLVGINSMVVNGLGAAVPASAVARFVERVLARRAA